VGKHREVGGAGGFKKLWDQRRLHAQVEGAVLDVLHDVPRMAGPRGDSHLSVDVAIDPVDGTWRQSDIPTLAELVHDPLPTGPVGVRDGRLVLDPTEECFFHEGLRIQIGGKDQEGVEGDGELRPGLERQEVDATLQRHDPSVQQLFGTHPLTTEVVDDEEAPVRLHLEGCPVGEGLPIHLEIQLVQGQLTAHHHRRTPHLREPGVEFQALQDLGHGVT
jgi:hypothetical protein